jgi:hypothetical protein
MERYIVWRAFRAQSSAGCTALKMEDMLFFQLSEENQTLRALADGDTLYLREIVTGQDTNASAA